MKTRTFSSSSAPTGSVHVVEGANQEQLTTLMATTSRLQFDTSLIQVIRPGGYISAASEDDCNLIATGLTAVAYEKHHFRLVEDACKFSTTTTTITSTTVTSTTKSTTTTTTPVQFQFACAGKSFADDPEQLLVVPEGLACETKLGAGMVDQLEELVQTCTASSQRPSFDCGTAARYAGRGVAVLGFDTRMLAAIAARVAHSLMVPMPPDITTCFCEDTSVNGDGAADCSSRDNGVPYCMTARGACSDGKRLAFFRDDLDYSQRACAYWMDTGTLQFEAPRATCSAVAALLNVAMEAHRSGRMHQCTPVSTSPTTTATTTPTTTPTTTTQTTSQTTSPTTSTTPTTTPTTTVACNPGEFLKAGSVCTMCPSGQWQDQISQPGCKLCTPLPTAMYERDACTPSTDNVYAPCTTCDAETAYEQTPCSEHANTVCAPITDCRARCTYHPDADICVAATTTKIGCVLLKPSRDETSGQIGCKAPGFDPSAADRCRYQPELNRCVEKWTPSASDTGSGCGSFPEHACRQSQATAGGKCMWDDVLYGCRNKACEDIHVPSKCASSSLGCAYNSDASHCHEKGTETPCSAFSSQGACNGASQNSDRCIFSDATGLCRVNFAMAGKVACELYSGEDLGKCPTDRCTLDPHASICRGQHETTPCEQYTMSTCPGSGDGVNPLTEFVRTPAAGNKDAQCQFVGADCDTAVQDDGGVQLQREYTKQASDATSDIICEAVTVCSLNDEFEDVAPTATSDRICAKATPPCFADVQFETAALTATSDRQCAVLSTCDHLGGEDDGDGDGATEYVVSAATATSNRECALLTVCSPTERQEFESKAARKESDRECAPFTPCDYVAGNASRYQSAPPGATHDRTCAVLAVCVAGEEYEATPPLGGIAYGLQVLVTNRECKQITRCKIPNEYESAPATASSDAQCATARAPCTLAAEYEAVPLTPTSNRECQAVTSCNMSAYPLSEPTPTSDRVCNSVYCPSGMYRIGVDSETRRLICADLAAPCNPTDNEYEDVAPTSTTDRVCATFMCNDTSAGAGTYLPAGAALRSESCKAWNSCLSGSEFEDTAPSSTSDRVCKAVSRTCDTLGSSPASFESSTPTPTSDRVCSACSKCANGFKTVTACSPTTDTVCSECSHCPAGEYAVSNCTDTKPALCSTCNRCLPGYFHVETCSPHTNAQCARCSRCVDDVEYESVACSADADIVCGMVAPPCNWPTEYEAAAPTKTSQRVCKNVTAACLDDEWEVAGPTSDSDRNCTKHSDCKTDWCPRTSWKLVTKADVDDDDADEDFTFVPNRWLQTNAPCPEPDNAEECINFGYDPQFQVYPPTASTNRVCRCPAFDVCPPGSYEESTPSKTNDRVCYRCPDGQFQSKPGQTSCEPVQECSAGNEWQSAEPTFSTDRVCRVVTNCPKQYETFAASEATAVSDRVCQNTTQCDDKTEWEEQAPTFNSDRDCGTIGVCRKLQFEVKPPTKSSPRLCALLAVCNEKQWECEAPNVTTVINVKGPEVAMKVTNRKCCARSTCSEGQFIQDEATATTDTLCEDYRVCNATEYESRAGTIDKNRRCSPVTDCAKPIPNTRERFEIKPASAAGDAVCADATVCPAGSHERTAPRSGADRTCRDCNGVTQWQNVSGQTKCNAVIKCDAETEFMAQLPTKITNGVCIALTVCAEHDYASTPHTASTDRKCSQCQKCDPQAQRTVATPCTRDANTVCRLATFCGREEFEAAPLTASSDRACQSHRVCGADEYADRIGTPTRDTFCARSTICSPGQFVAKEAAQSADRICEACTKEVSYSVANNAAQCSNCTSGCPPGMFVAAHCTRLADAVCEECPYGSFSSDGAECIPWMEMCPPGTAEILTPNSYHNRGCMLCQRDTFRSATSALSGSKTCVPHTQCAAPRYRPAHAANSTTDTVCELAPTTTSTATTTTATTATVTSVTATTTTESLFRLAEKSKSASTAFMTSALYVAAGFVGVIVLAIFYLCCDCRGLYDGAPTRIPISSAQTAIDVQALRLRQAEEDAIYAADIARIQRRDRLMKTNPEAFKRGRRPSIHKQSSVVNFEGTEVSEL